MWNPDPRKLRAREGMPASFLWAAAEELKKPGGQVRPGSSLSLCYPWAYPFLASWVNGWILTMEALQFSLFSYPWGVICSATAPCWKPPSCTGDTLVPLKSHIPCGTPWVWILNSLDTSSFTLILQVKGAALCPSRSGPPWACFPGRIPISWSIRGPHLLL